MALVIADRVLETTTTAGSGTITLAGAKPGYQSFSAIGNGNTTYYTIALQNGAEWEVGIGTYTASGTTLSRDTVLSSSANGAKVTFSAGTKDVFVDYPAEKAIFPGTSGNISALSGKIINLAAPENDNDATTKLYVDGLVATGLYYHDPVQLTTTSAFTGYSITYNNGTLGVSATITQASSYSSLTIDSTAAAVGNRILVKDAANAAYNGVYVVNDTGSGSTPWVMMRSTDTDSYGSSAGNLSQNDYFYTQNGVVNKGSAYVCSTEGTIVFGTTAINFAQFSSSQVYVAGTGIDITGVTVSLQTPVTVPNGGTGASTLTGYVKGNGASALSTVSTIPASDISGTLSISQGGTGSGTQQGAINALAGAVTSGYYLRGSGTNVSMSAIQAGDVPTLNQNTTGQAGSVANALTLSNAGAGDASGTTYNGSAARTISYNSIGAAPSDGSTTITKLGTVTAGTWNANIIGVSYGGTGASSLAAANIAVINTSNTFTAAQTFRAASAVRSEAASTQDAIVLAGRAGGTSSYAVTFTPATLSANRTVTLPDTTGTIILNTTNSGSNITLDTLFGGF